MIIERRNGGATASSFASSSSETVQPDGFLNVTDIVAGARPASEFERVLTKLLVGR
jgi:hypothetical protein